MSVKPPKKYESSLNLIEDSLEDAKTVLNMKPEEAALHYLKVEKYYLQKQNFPECCLCMYPIPYSELKTHLMTCLKYKKSCKEMKIMNSFTPSFQHTIHSQSQQSQDLNISQTSVNSVNISPIVQRQLFLQDQDEYCFIRRSDHRDKKISKRKGAIYLEVPGFRLLLCNPSHLNSPEIRELIKSKFASHNIPIESVLLEESEKKCDYSLCSNQRPKINDSIRVYSIKFFDQTLFRYCSKYCMFNHVGSLTIDKIESHSFLKEKKRNSRKRKKDEEDQEEEEDENQEEGRH